ncbi:MAG: transposase [Pseudaminobacter sp.]|nr:transposase [Pseudaminobacter sp.]
MGQKDIRRLLVTGAMAVIRWALRRGAPRNPWLARLLERKPPMVAAFALANKMARGIWAMLTRRKLSRSSDRWRLIGDTGRTGPQSCEEGMSRMGK